MSGWPASVAYFLRPRFGRLPKPARHASGTGPDRPTYRADLLPGTTVLLLAGLAVVIAAYTLARTSHPVALKDHMLAHVKPARAQLDGAALVPRPANWTSYDIAARQYFAGWCKRPDTPACPTDPDAFDRLYQSVAFRREFAGQRETLISGLAKPDLSQTDLRDALMRGAFLPGVRMHQVQLADTNLERATLEGAEIISQNLSGARFARADLRGVEMVVGSAPGEQVARDVNFFEADLQGATLSVYDLKDARFLGTRLDHAVLVGRFQGVFDNSPDQAISFRNADLSLAEFRFSLIRTTGPNDIFANANVAGWFRTVSGDWGLQRRPRFAGSALHNVDLSNTVRRFPTLNADPWLWRKLLENSFGDHTVRLPDGIEAPCQWLADPYSGEAEFFGTWRAWLEKGGHAWPPSEMIGKLDWRPTGPGQVGRGLNLASENKLKTVPSLPENIPSDCTWLD